MVPQNTEIKIDTNTHSKQLFIVILCVLGIKIQLQFRLENTSNKV